MRHSQRQLTANVRESASVDTSKAACRDYPTDVFFPPGSGLAENTYPVQEELINVARQVCAACPVKVECLHVHLFDPSGVFGGLPSKERKALVRLLEAS